MPGKAPREFSTQRFPYVKSSPSIDRPWSNAGRRRTISRAAAREQEHTLPILIGQVIHVSVNVLEFLIALSLVVVDLGSAGA